MYILIQYLFKSYFEDEMDFRRARTQEQFNQRRDEIIKCCDEILSQEGIEAITLQAITKKTTLNRSSIYNYFSTKEEILLQILVIELRKWVTQLSEKTYESKEEFIKFFSQSLSTRKKMLDLLGILNTKLEPHASLQSLITFKQDSYEVFKDLEKILIVFCKTKEMSRDVIFSMFSLIAGLYSFCNPTQKQIQASKDFSHYFQTPPFEAMCAKSMELLLFKF